MAASIVDKILSLDEQKAVVEAIASAERDTSGEIRVHVDRECAGDAMARAVKLFRKLKMYRTQGRNGVLIYIAVDSHQLAIVGDVNIDKVVDDNFWHAQKDIMIECFKTGDYSKGLTTAIRNTGQELKKYFPYDEKGDVNELTNDISHS